MKSQIFAISSMLLLVLFGAVFTSGCQEADKGQKAGDAAVEQPSDLQVMVFEVKGMTCSGCEGTINKAVQKVTGVYKAKADHQKEQVEVLVAKGTEVDEQAIVQAILDANYTPGKRIQ